MAQVVQFLVSDDSFVSIRSGYSRRGANLTPSNRLDYSINYTNCPSELAGLGEAPLVVNYATPSARERLGVLGDISAGSLVGGEWRVTVPAVAMTLEERKARMKAVATEKAKERKAGTTTVSIGEEDVTIFVNADVGVEVLLSDKKVGPSNSLGIVTRSGRAINMNASLRGAIEGAVVDRFAAIVQREYDLHVAIDAAEDHDELDLIDPESESS